MLCVVQIDMKSSVVETETDCMSDGMSQVTRHEAKKI